MPSIENFINRGVNIDGPTTGFLGPVGIRDYNLVLKKDIFKQGEPISIRKFPGGYLVTDPKSGITVFTEGQIEEHFVVVFNHPISRK